jgi:hypothetical protein
MRSRASTAIVLVALLIITLAAAHHAHCVAVPERRHEVQPQPLHIRRQIHGGADDGTTRRMRLKVWVAVPQAGLTACRCG